jgi:hypothetical protein
VHARWTPAAPRVLGSRIEASLSLVTTLFLFLLAAAHVLLIAGLVETDVLGAGSAGERLALVALIALVPAALRWILSLLFELWGTRWTYRSIDGTRWGALSSLFGWVGAGEGVCVTSLERTAPGMTLLSSEDAIHAGLPAVAAHLSRLQGAKGKEAFAPFDALMLAAFAGLAARGSATISSGRALRWKKDWLRATRRAPPEPVFTIERARSVEDGGAVERHILDALQSLEDALAAPPHDAPEGGYRAPTDRPFAVRVPLEDALPPPALRSAAAALATPALGGAPIAVAVAIDDFAKRDPARLAHLRRVLAQRAGR